MPEGFDKKDIEQNKVLAAISYLWIISIIMLVTKKDSPFVQFHAKQGVVIFGLSIVAWIVFSLILQRISYFLFGTVEWLVNLALFVLALIGLIKALQGEVWKIPLISDLVKGLKL